MDSFEPNRTDTQYCLSVSYGKDSLACIGACEKLGWRIDRIIHAEIWATDDIPADLPPMVNFKAKADKIIKDRWGIEVEHYCAVKKGNFTNPRQQEESCHTMDTSTEGCQKNESERESMHIQKAETMYVTTRMETARFMDFHSDSEHGAIQNSSAEQSNKRKKHIKMYFTGSE